MYHQPKVSVIIPAYNSEKFVNKAFESVTRQSLTELQIILIDDGSTDQTPVLFQQFKMQDNRVEVITHKTNQGLGAARNSGIKAARGEYISFLDSDDYLHLNFLESLYEKAKSEKLDILQAQYIKHINDNKTVFPKNMIPFAQAVSGISYYREGIMIEPQAWAKLWKTSFINKHQLQFASGYYEDMIMVHRAFALSKRVNNILLPGYHYIVHNQSITGQTTTTRHLHDYMTALNGLQALFMQKELVEPQSGFPASFGMFLVRLCRMTHSLDKKETKQIKEFIRKMTARYGKIIRKNNNLPWIKRQIIGRYPCRYAQMKK